MSLAVFLSSQCKLVLFQRRQDTEIVLNPSGVVVGNIVLDHLYQLLSGSEAPAVVAFPLEDAPETFHRAIVNAVSHAGHTLFHLGFLQHVVECAVCVLKSAVTVEQRVRIRVFCHCLLECIEHQGIVIAVTNHIRDNPAVIQVENRAQVELVDFNTLIPLEFCYICKPLGIGLGCIKIPVQDVLCQVLWISSVACTAVATVLNSGLDALYSANAQYSFVVHMNTVIVFQVVPDAPVAFIWAFCVDLLDLLCKLLVVSTTFAQLSGKPCIIGGTGYMEIRTPKLDWVSIFLVALPNTVILLNLSYLSKASLLSISANFFSR